VPVLHSTDKELSFGFNDGISHPQVFGINDSSSLSFKIDDVVQSTDNSNFVKPGVIPPTSNLSG
jgi:hypothetical protein